MNTCPTVKEVTMPGCYSGVLKVNTGLAPGTPIVWAIQAEGGRVAYSDGGMVDESGNILLDYPGFNYFNTYKLSFKSDALEHINIKGYDCYRLLPVKNANEVVDVVI